MKKQEESHSNEAATHTSYVKTLYSRHPDHDVGTDFVKYIRQPNGHTQTNAIEQDPSPAFLN